MKFSLNKLRKLAKINNKITDLQIIDALFSLGFEVESHNKFVTANNVIIGTIESIVSHPNADKLQCTKINIGDQLINIITGAQNIYEKSQVIVFLPGAKCGNVIYKTATLRGLKSYGMLASLNELGIDNDVIPEKYNNGVHIIEHTKFRNGENALIALGLDDIIIDINILANRGDAYSYYVIATEIAAYFDISINLLNDKIQGEIQSKNTPQIWNFIIKNQEKSSSWEIQILLMKSGIKPLSQTIDDLNIQLLMYGQSIQMYDYDLLTDDKNIIKKYTGEIKIADNKKIVLNNNLVIFNKNNLVALAGVTTIDHYTLSHSSKKILVELGKFDGHEIRRTTQMAKINNHLSNINTHPTPMYLLQLLAKYLNKKYVNINLNIDKSIASIAKIKVTNDDFNKYAGYNIVETHKWKKMNTFLVNIGYEINNNIFIPPKYRSDIINKFDVIEDAFRGYNYNNIIALKPKITSTLISNTVDIKSIISAQGYQEVFTYSLKNAEYNLFNPFQISKKVEIISEIHDNKLYRWNMVMSLINIAIHNDKYKLGLLNLFELGFINGDHNKLHLAYLSNEKSFYEIKKNIISLFTYPNNLRFLRTKYDLLHVGTSVDIYYMGKYIGFIGKIHPKHLNVDYWVAEINTMFMTGINDQTFIPYKASQLFTRDLTIAIKKEEDFINKFNQKTSKLSIEKIEYLTLFRKNKTEKTITVKLYLDEVNAKLFDKYCI